MVVGVILLGRAETWWVAVGKGYRRSGWGEGEMEKHLCTWPRGCCKVLER